MSEAKEHQEQFPDKPKYRFSIPKTTVLTDAQRDFLEIVLRGETYREVRERGGRAENTSKRIASGQGGAGISNTELGVLRIAKRLLRREDDDFTPNRIESIITFFERGVILLKDINSPIEEMAPIKVDVSQVAQKNIVRLKKDYKHKFTDNQISIIQGTMSGRINTEIAQDLGITVNVLHKLISGRPKVSDDPAQKGIFGIVREMAGERPMDMPNAIFKFLQYGVIEVVPIEKKV